MNLLLFVTVAICLVLLVLCDRTMVQDDSTIAEINNLSPGWRAGHNPRFNNVSLADAAKLLGLAEVPTNLRASPKRLDSSVSVPASFDARQKWPQCIMPIRDQRSCGGCWGFAGASMFGMRQCIQSGGAVKVDMSPQYPISCDTANNGCNGGTIGSVWSFFQSSGSVADSSYPFTSGNGNTGTCSLRSGQQKYFAASYRRLSSVAEMQEEIYNNGAIQVGFDVYQDFYNYRSGVYVRTSNQKSGGHSVYVVGWGQANGTPYWIAINSWSANWGMGGTFYIRRGTNECNIETGFRPVAAVIRVVASPTTAVTTTRAPSSGGAGYDTRGCWTCPAGMTHWFNAGYGAAPGGDQCSCVSSGASPTTTRAPTAAPTTRAPSSGGYDTRGCWTCPAGMTHWFNAGLSTAPGGDQCACVVGGGSPTTRAPTSAPAPPSGGAGYDTRGCWTCPSGFTHWFNAGLSTAPGNDRCACVAARATPTTARPTAYNTRGCWTCPSGYIHWFAKGYSSPTNGDQCQCLPQ